jgi:hypothetical protein
MTNALPRFGALALRRAASAIAHENVIPSGSIPDLPQSAQDSEESLAALRTGSRKPQHGDSSLEGRQHGSWLADPLGLTAGVVFSTSISYWQSLERGRDWGIWGDNPTSFPLEHRNGYQRATDGRSTLSAYPSSSAAPFPRSPRCCAEAQICPRNGAATWHPGGHSGRGGRCSVSSPPSKVQWFRCRARRRSAR